MEAYIAAELPGSRRSAELRSIARATFDLANAVQHLQGATPRDAALVAETTESLVNVISIIAGRQTEAGRLHGDVGQLVQLREHGVQLLNRRVQNDDELTALQAELRTWEGETLARTREMRDGK